MFRTCRLVHAILLCLCSVVAFPQGSAGGYGQAGGGGSGGFGGGQGFIGNTPGRPDGLYRGGGGEDKKTRPEDDELWEQKSAVLTPGDRVEFKLKLKAGETVMASATSDAFDPALSVEDAKGKVLAKNDDRAEGDQSPFIIFRAAQGGAYTLKVLSFRSVSGGKFLLKMRTFAAIDAGLGKATHELKRLEQGQSARVVFRLTSKKGATYDLRYLTTLKPYRSRGNPLARIIGPTGVEASDFERILTGDSTPVFKALADGDYYAEYLFAPEAATEMETDFHEVSVITVKPTSNQNIDFSPQELKIIEFPVSKNSIIRTTLTANDISQAFSSPKGTGTSRGSDEGYGTDEQTTWFQMNRDSDLDITRIFHGDGNARMTIRAMSEKPQKVGLANTESLPEWTGGEAMKGAMAIGESKLFVVNSAKSELMKVVVGADHFQPKIDILRMTGELANTIMDRQTHTASDDLYFPDKEMFVIRLTCDGFGGSGDYSMKRDVISAAPYPMGKTEALTLDGTNFGLYAVDLEAGKRYQLMTDEPNKMLRADLLDEDGQFLVSQRIRFDNVEVQYFVPTRSGRHRLWLRGEPGTRQFSFVLHTPPKLGGG